jgi:hypothetical protein
MSSQKEEVVLDFKVEQQDVISELEKLKKVIFENKKEQLELAKAFKSGKITLEEYSKGSVRVENNLKSQNKTYNDLQKSVLGHKSKIDELIKSNNKLSDSVKSASQNLNVAGVNVGSLTTKLTSLANPTTLAAAAAGALATAYASSTVGARDLAFASDQLSFVTGKLSEDLGRLVGGEDGGGGKGLLSTLTNKYLELVQLVPIIKGLDLVTGDAVSKYLESLRKGSQEAAKALQQLRDIEVSLALAKGFFKNDERQIELSRRDRDDESKSLKERIELADKIDNLFASAQIRTKTILETQRQLIIDSTIGYDNNRDAQLAVQKITAEIADLEEMVTGKLTENYNVRQKLLAIAQSEAGIRRINAAVSPEEQARILKPKNLISDVAQKDSDDIIAKSEGQRKLDLQKLLLDAEASMNQQHIEEKKKEEQMFTDFYSAQLQTRLQSAAMVSNALTGLFEEGSEAQKFFALISLGADTAEAIGSLTAASEGNPLNSVTYGAAGIVQYATGIARIIGNIATAKEYLGFQTGGYTGDGNPHDVAGVVHKKEVVWNAQDVSMMGGPSVVNAMRPTARYRHSRGGGYYDGGIVAKSASNEVNQQLAMINAIKSMPPPVVSAVEMTKAQNRVIVKQNISKR